MPHFLYVQLIVSPIAALIYGQHIVLTSGHQKKVDLTKAAAVSQSDLDILTAARSTAENAETAFNTAIAAASGTTAAALQVGKIKNKVLKLRLFEMQVLVQEAQGATDKAAELTNIQTLLAANVKTDQASAGKTSQSVSFTGDVQP